MKLYYHKTNGGAEYYSTKCVAGTDEGAIEGVIMRVDGGEIEIFTERMKSEGLTLKIN